MAKGVRLGIQAQLLGIKNWLRQPHSNMFRLNTIRTRRKWHNLSSMAGNVLYVRLIPQVVTRAYKGIWEKVDEYVGLGQFARLLKSDNIPFLSPISPAEAVHRMDQKKAAGPDGGMGAVCVVP